MIVILIIGLLIRVVVPNLQGLLPRHERRDFITNITTLIQFSWQHALSSGALTRVVFNFEKRTIHLEEQIDPVLKEDPKNFRAVTTPQQETSYTWPPQFVFRNFIVEGFDEMSRFSGKNTGTAWFYVLPTGGTQEVTMNMSDTKDKKDGRPRPIGIVVNPFTAQCKVYDEFQK